MKIIVKSRSEEMLEEYDYRDFMKIEINGEKRFEVYDGESEDANLSRDFVDCWLIPQMMREAFEAGKNGETFELETLKEE